MHIESTVIFCRSSKFMHFLFSHGSSVQQYNSKMKHLKFMGLTYNRADCITFRPKRDQEFSILGFPGRDFAKSRDPGIFRDGISLKFYQKKYRISRDFLLSSQIWSNSYILEDSFACVIVKSNLGLLRGRGFRNK